MVDKLKLTNRLMNVRDKSKVFHSSGYATAQNGKNFGAASSETFTKRQTVDENRKFVRKYNNARIINDARAFDRVRQYVPRTGGAAGAGETDTGTGVARGTTRLAGPTVPAAPPAGPATPPARRVAPVRPR